MRTHCLLPALRSLVLLTVLPAAALAHPGHDGPHDFEWDLGHLATHPLATFAGLAFLAAAGWAVARSLRRRAPAPIKPRQ